MCNDFRIKTQDNSTVICGRSMQFPIPQESQIVTYNREERFESTAPDGTKGLEWTSKYGFTGISAFHIDAPDEGMNEAGLSFGVLILEGSTYQKVPDDQKDRALAMTDVSKWILGNFATVQEVKEAMNSVFVWGQFIKPMNEIPGLHIALHDAEGNDLVIEFIDGKVNCYDNPNGVLTNNPPLPSQLENLKKYEEMHISPTDGMKGIPGSWMPDDRFVRLSLEVQKSIPANQDEGMEHVIHILNETDLPIGVETCKFVNTDFTISTLWQSMKDLKKKVFYFRPQNDPTFRAIDLTALNFSKGTQHPRIPVWTKGPTIINITPDLNPKSRWPFNQTIEIKASVLEHKPESAEKATKIFSAATQNPIVQPV